MYNNNYGYGPLMPKDVTDEAFDTTYNALHKALTIIGVVVGFLIGLMFGFIIRKIIAKIREIRLKKQIEKEETRLQSAPRLIFELNPEVLRDKAFIALRKRIEMQALSHYFRKVVKEKSLIFYDKNVKSWRQFTEPQSDAILENILYPLADNMSKVNKTKSANAMEKR